MSKEQKGKAILLSTELYGRIEERIETAGFRSVAEYITFVLEEVLKEEESVFSEEQEEEVKKKLRTLGYLE